MKNKVALFLTSMIFTSFSFAQKFQGDIHVSAGGVWHQTDFLNKMYVRMLTPEALKTKSKISPNFSVDYGLSDRISLGLGMNVSEYITHFSSYVDKAGVKSPVGEYIVNCSNINSRFRFLYHIGDNDDLDVHFGVGLGYNFNYFKGNAIYSSDAFNKALDNTISKQVLVGAKYFFSYKFGLNLEAAIGQSYNAFGGICYRFGE